MPRWLAIVGLLALAWSAGSAVATRGERRALWSNLLFLALAVWALVEAAGG